MKQIGIILLPVGFVFFVAVVLAPLGVKTIGISPTAVISGAVFLTFGVSALGKLRRRLNWRTEEYWAALGVLAVASALLIGALREEGDFQAMTASAHLAAAKTERDAHHIDLAVRHLQAISRTAPEAFEAQQIDSEILAEQEAVRNAKRAKEDAVRELQSTLKSLGYDVSVVASSTADEIVITSADFGETEHRISFLALLRGSVNSMACFVGFRNVRLKAGWFGFNETYALNC